MTHELTAGVEGTQISHIRSVAKALMIVDLLAKGKREMSLGEIAKEMNIAKSTAYGLIATMRDFGYIEQSVYDGRYRLGIRFFEVGNAVANSWDVRQIASPFLQNLVDTLGETVHLVVLDKGEVLYIDKRESRQSLRIVSQIGNRLPAHCTAVGKAILAFLSSGELKRIVATRGMQRYTKNTITELPLLELELERIRQQGFAIESEEIMDGLRCVGVPLKDHNGKVCAALSVSGPVGRLDGENLQIATETILRAGQEISAILGYRL